MSQPTSPTILGSVNTNTHSSPTSSPNAVFQGRKAATAATNGTVPGVVVPQPTPMKAEQQAATSPSQSNDPSLTNSAPATASPSQCHIFMVPPEVLSLVTEFVPVANEEVDGGDEEGAPVAGGGGAGATRTKRRIQSDRRAMTLVCRKWRKALMSRYGMPRHVRAEIGWSQKRHENFLGLIRTGQVHLVGRLLQQGGYIDWGYDVVRVGQSLIAALHLDTESDATALLRAAGASGLMVMVTSVVKYLSRRRDSAYSGFGEIMRKKAAVAGKLLPLQNLEVQEQKLQNELENERTEHNHVLWTTPHFVKCVTLALQGAMEEGHIKDNGGAHLKMCLQLMVQLEETMQVMKSDSTCVFECAHLRATDSHGRTPLHYVILAARNDPVGSRKVIDMLIDDGKVDVNLQDNLGNTAAHYAAIAQNHDLMPLLQDKGANLDLRNLAGETPGMIHAKARIVELEQKAKEDATAPPKSRHSSRKE